ncbi:T9SS sorting signal type C domain-containing protein [Flavobacterium sp. CFBP9031]|uniref:T9SS sorting signal type C domain-containing protein n=1 Tax=Flavobacterium sp. CFBP9031 TaxID=3096538 RepID=UPI002A6A7554|nr:T9SS sorting signal type C domain-containing protein [Flavobacterium sp. CFBP9031]MDY0990353.1 T9SS sorting signal type C domain-containing protein [Flavobacterium sp. CFBP9031]
MKKTLLLFLLLPFFGFAQLNRNYIIGSKTGADFKNLPEAIEKLKDVGIDRDIQFLLDENQNLSSQLTITSFKNKNKNTVTIRPNDGKEIIITGKVSNGALIALNNADHIIIDGNNTVSDNKLKIYNNFDDINNSYSSRVAIWLYKKSENNSIKNLTIELNTLGDAIGTTSTGILASGDSFDSNANNADNTIQNVIFVNVKQAIVVKGQNKNNIGWKILNNKVSTKAFLGISLLNVSDYTVKGNTLDGIKIPSNFDGTFNFSGIYLENANDGTVSNNTISNIENRKGYGIGYPMYIKGDNATISKNTVSNFFSNSSSTGALAIKVEGNGASIFNNKISAIISDQAVTASGIYTTGDNQLLYNNFVLDVSSAGGGGVSGQNAFGIYIDNGSSIKLYHNSVKLITNQPNGCSSALYVRDGSGFDIRNNIFVNAQTSGSERFAVYFESADRSKFTTLDYNNYYSSQYVGTFGSYYTSTNKKITLDEWKEVTSRDTNSKNGNPLFLNNSLYLDANNAVNKTLVGTETLIATVPTDIDNNARLKPYMGAHELAPCVPTGDQTAFGPNTWIGYVYKMANNAALPPNISYPALPNTSIATYIGIVTENKNFDRNIGGGSVTGQTSNFACDTAPSDRFFVRYKMLAEITEAGLYSFDIGSDDGVRLYIDDAAVPIITRWNGHGFTMDYATQNLTVGQHKFVLEYYEDGGDSRVSFFTGIQKGNPSEYGDKVWNVYGYVNNDITLQNVRYAGYYVDPHLNPDSTNYWTKDKSPSSATIWQGSQIPDNNFTVVYKRKGFDCGLYQLKHMNHDDAVELYIDDKLIFSKDGWDNATYLINGGDLYPLNSESRVEIRLREDGGDANLGINFTKTDIVYNGTGTIPNGSSLVISSNTELKSDLTVCSCTVNPNVTLTVPKDVTLTVDENVTIGTGGKLLILDGGSFLQTSTSKNMFTGSNTAFEIQRITEIRRFDLTYWSSPVDNPDFKMSTLSPETLFDKFFYWTSDFKWATDLYGKKTMEPGKGYSIRGPQSFDTQNPSNFTGKFYGKPNNGNILIPITADKYHFVGNPYPSAIDARKFIRDNGEVGPLYFWTHVSSPKKENGSNTYTYSSPDYAVLTLLGSTKATTGGEEPSGYIGVGQGFFIKPRVTSVTFTNEQRVKAQNTQFYKTSAKETEVEVNRLWLNLSNTEDAFKQLLVGYAEGASNSYDHNFDATTMSGNSFIDFYTINEAKKLTVQARALPFDNTDTVPLGYKTTVSSELTISIDHADGFFNKQAVYLEDKTTGIITDLRASNYTFQTAAGTFTERFVLRYTNKTLGTDDFENVQDGVLVSIKSKVINAVSGTENIKEVQIYTIGGQLLYNKSKIDAKELEITNLHSSNQVLLVKVILENGHVVTKKIIFN